jgi:hypothetical protein
MEKQMSTEDTGITPETGADNKALDSATPPQGTPPKEDNALQTEVERLRKEREQIEMERNMLRKKLEAEEKAKAETAAKELEEKEEFKTLYEQEKEARLALEQEAEEKARKAEVNSKKAEVLAEFPQDVKELADEFGYELIATDDETVAAYKAKLLKVQEKISQGQAVGPNNPSGPKKAPVPEGDDLKLALKDPKTFDEIIAAKFPGIQQMTRKQQ